MNWWENNFLKVRNNRLLLSGREASALADEYGTPLYVYGKDQILANLDQLRTAFKAATPLELRVCYAVKANPNEEILRLLRTPWSLDRRSFTRRGPGRPVRRL